MLAKIFKKFKYPPLSKKEQGIFAERLSLLLGASLSLPESIAVMRNSFGKRRSRALSKLETSLESGMNFESALLASSLCFVRMVVLAGRIGERSGTLSESLLGAAGRIERDRAVKSALVSAMTYPAIIFLASAAIIAFLVFFIIPKIMPTIESLHVPLPLVTIFFVSLSHFLVSAWWKIALESLLVGAVLLFLYKRSSRFKGTFQRCLLRTPLVGTIIRAHMLSEIFDVISTLVSAGCPLIDAVAESSLFIGFVPYRSVLSNAVSEMQSGLNLSTVVRRHPRLFPDLAVDSLAIGERTGNMEAVLSQMSRYYSRESQAALAGFSKLIEPVLMISVGAIVGAAALSIVLPIYEISQHLSG